MVSGSTAGRSGEGVILAFLAFGNFIIGMGAFVIIGIVSPIAEGLGIGKADAGLVLTVYALAYAVLSPVTGALTGTLSRRIVLVASLAIFALGTVLSAISTGLPMLAASRVLVALGGSLYAPAAAGIAVAISAPERRGKALATVFSGGTLAQVLGTPFGAWVAYHFGWEAAFWVIAALSLAGSAVMCLAIPRDVRFQAAGLATILAALQDRRAMIAVSFTATMLAAFYVVFTFFGPLIEASVGPNPETRTGFLMLNGLGAFIGNILGGMATDRIGARRTLVAICIVQILILPLFSILPLPPLALAVLIGTWSATSFGFMAPQQARVAQFAPEAIGIMLSVNAAMLYVGITIGSVVGSHILGWYGLGALGMAASVLALLALLHLLAAGHPRASAQAPRR
ncbi:MAG TPA: MFS transporter [Hypericibacter adhaerens]|uniref:MFS transporter n=1 Tax=Hypericibacter adhaerens TaxID=2602016 RepID=UPI002C9DD2FB|nr:MFS transporter [Hypericibacter adhaerens]HWA42305.1 MFS transporter [Hypericibacter adhaerens]